MHGAPGLLHSLLRLPCGLGGGGVAPQVGLEPTTLRLTAGCSTIELLRIGCGGEILRKAPPSVKPELAATGPIPPLRLAPITRPCQDDGWATAPARWIEPVGWGEPPAG